MGIFLWTSGFQKSTWHTHYRPRGKVIFSEACVRPFCSQGGGGARRETPLRTETHPSGQRAPSRQPLPELTSHLVAVTAAVGTHPTGMPYFNMFVEERESANRCPVHRHTYLKWFSQRVLENSPYFLLSRAYWSQNKRPILFNYQYHSRTRDYKLDKQLR